MFVSALSFVGCGSQKNNGVVNLGVLSPIPGQIRFRYSWGILRGATIPSVDEEEHPVEAKGFNKRDDLFLRRMLTHCDIIPLDDEDEYRYAGADWSIPTGSREFILADTLPSDPYPGCQTYFRQGYVISVTIVWWYFQCTLGLVVTQAPLAGTTSSYSAWTAKAVVSI